MAVRRFRLLFHVLAGLLAVGLTVATQAPSRAEATPVGYASITGHIKNPDGTPYAGGGSLSVYHLYQRDGQSAATWQDIGGYTTNAPGSDGAFAITDVALFSSTEELRIGLASTGGYDGQFYSGSWTLAGATSVPVTVGQTKGGIDFTLAKNPDFGAMSGHVIGPDGAPLEGVPVKVYPVAGGIATISFTDSNGAWLQRADAGAYTVSFSEVDSDPWATAWYGGADQSSATPVNVSAGGTTSAVDAQLTSDTSLATIGGTLTGPTGAPARNVEVRIYDLDHTTAGVPDSRAVYSDRDTGKWSAVVKGGQSYKIGFSVDDGDTWQTQYWQNAVTLDRATVIGPQAGQDLTFDAQLRPLPIVNLHRPAVSGTPLVGRTLTASPGTWSPTATPHYQWLADGAPIRGATSARLTLGGAQAGHHVSVRITATEPGYATATAISARTAVVKAVPHLRLTTKAASHGRTTIRFVVTAAVPVTGQAQIYLGTRRLWAGRLVDGRRTVTIGLSRGMHTLRAHYLGSSRVRAATVRHRFRR